MSGSPIALAIVAAIVFGTIVFALLAVRRIKMDPAQYIVGGRSFGTIFLWVLLAGEIYTTFTFLGIAGLSYSAGAPAFYVIAYGAAAYAIGYFLTPAMWRVAKEFNLLTGPDFFETRYNSRALGVATAILYFLMVVPYVALQLSGLQILLRIAGYGAYDATVSVCVAFLVLAFFVFTAGLRGTAWASIVKDILVLGAVLFAGVAIPMRFFGSPSAMFDRVLAQHPQMLVLPAGGAIHGTIWFASTVLLSAIGFFMGPQTISAVYSARSEESLRRNAVLLPFYQAFVSLMIFAGLSAAMIVPGLKGTAVDQSFLLVVQHYYPPWILGLVAAAGALAALIPASALLLAGSAVITKNVARRCVRHRNRRCGAHSADAHSRDRRRIARARILADRAAHRRGAALTLLQWHHPVCTRSRRLVPLAARHRAGRRRRNRRGPGSGDSAGRSQPRALGH